MPQSDPTYLRPDVEAPLTPVDDDWIRLSILIAALTYAGVGTVLWLGQAPVPFVVQPYLAALVVGATYPLCGRYPRAAGMVALMAVWCELTYTIFSIGALEPSSLLVYPALIVAAGLLLSETGALAWAVLSGVAIPVALFAGRAMGHRPSAEENHLVAVVVTELSMLGSAFFARYVMRHLRQRHLETERQRRKFATLFQQVPDAVIELGRSGAIREANAAAVALLAAPHALLLDRPLAEVFAQHGFAPPDFDALGDAGGSVLLSTAGASAAVRHWEVRVRREQELGGRSLVVVRDVTLQRSLAERQADFQRLETVARLAAGIAHDFNNLLTAIGGHAALVAMSGDTQVQQHAAAITTAQKRGAKLTQQMLSFARNTYREPRVLLVAQEMLEWTDLFRRVIGRNATLEFKGEGGCFIEADRTQLEQILLNLLANAGDASPAGATIELRVARLPHAEAARLGSTLAAPRQVLFAVVDRGAGMTPEVKRHLFEPFFTTKPPGQGTGMGLAATYGLVAQNLGSIHLESAPGEGTAARVFFPERAAGAGVAPRGA